MLKKFTLTAAMALASFQVSAQQYTIIGFTQTLNESLNSLGLQESLAPLIPQIQSGSALASQILESTIPLGNDLPLVGAIVGSAVPIGTQLATLGLPALTALPSDPSGLVELLSTHPSTVIQILLPTNSGIALPGL